MTSDKRTIPAYGRITREEYRVGAAKPKRSKYGARRTCVDGFTYDSAREAAVIEGYRRDERLGLISGLERQKRFVLQAPNGIVIGVYKADAAFYDHAQKRERVIDVKGYDTDLSAWKRKHVKAQYGIDVEVVK